MKMVKIKMMRSGVGLGALALLALAVGARSAQFHAPTQESQSEQNTQKRKAADVITPRGKVMTWGEPADSDGKVKNGKPMNKGWVSLFDGKTLNGWVGEKGYWEVKDGAIVGDKHGSTPHHHYMFSTKDYSDFACHIDVKLVGYNSGVCARIHPKDFDDVPGYQVDMAEGYWGCLWDEHHRQTKIVDYPKEEADKIVHKGGWNHYYFTMQGHHITMYLNGVKTADVDDPGGFDSGPLGFQLCHGDNSIVGFKNIYVKLIQPQQARTAPAPPRNHNPLASANLKNKWPAANLCSRPRLLTGG